MQTRLRLSFCAALAIACAAVPAAPASASLIETSACDGAELTQPFQRWGDDALYKLIPGGDAEGSLDGWSLTGGAKRASGSEPFAATGAQGAASFAIPGGGSVTTSATCVNAAYPSFRFFAKSSGGLLGLVPTLTVSLIYREGLLGLVEVPVGVMTLPSSWKPSPVMLTASAVGAAVAGGEAPLALRFRSLGGTWTVDDVFVDPYRRN
jgi:hypothetical protein